MATGVVGTGLVVTDRRTSGAQLEDEGIELRASHAIDEKYGDRVHVNASSFNRNLLLTGEVPDQTVRKDVEAIARATANVRSVINETAIAGNSSLSERTNDAYLTTKVRARFLADANGRFSPVQVSITSEAGVVYLMGLVTHAEGDAATNIASTTAGVRRVVKVFEYIAHVPESEKPATASSTKSGAVPVTASTPAPATASAPKPVEPTKPADIQAPAPQKEDVLPPAQPVTL